MDGKLKMNKILQFYCNFYLDKSGFAVSWNYKSNKDYLSEKNRDKMLEDKIHIKCDYFDGSILDGVWEPKLFSFGLIRPPGFKYFLRARNNNF